MNASRVSNDNHCTNDASKLKEDKENNLKLLQKKNDDIKKLTEIVNVKSKIIAQMKEKEVIYEHFKRKVQVLLVIENNFIIFPSHIIKFGLM